MKKIKCNCKSYYQQNLFRLMTEQNTGANYCHSLRKDILMKVYHKVLINHIAQNISLQLININYSRMLVTNTSIEHNINIVLGQCRINWGNVFLLLKKKKKSISKHPECTVVYFTLNEICKNKQQKQNYVKIFPSHTMLL